MDTKSPSPAPTPASKPPPPPHKESFAALLFLSAFLIALGMFTLWYSVSTADTFSEKRRAEHRELLSNNIQKLRAEPADKARDILIGGIQRAEASTEAMQKFVVSNSHVELAIGGSLLACVVFQIFVIFLLRAKLAKAGTGRG